MKRTNDQTMKEAIEGMLKAFRLDYKLREKKLLGSWEVIMGKTVSIRTEKMFVSDRKLFVYLNSASLREDLHRERQKIMNRLNEEAGADVIDDIIFQ